MKWLRTIVLFDKGAVMGSPDWAAIHTSYTRSIERIEFPSGSGLLTLRRKERIGKQFNRNGVGYLKSSFLENMVSVEGWSAEAECELGADIKQVEVQMYPTMEKHNEPISSEFGGFDLLTVMPSGAHVAIEWETGNISSSHRSMNKLAIALAANKIQAGVMIVPSRNLYEHLTDRIGNIGELSGYLSMWQTLGVGVKKGLLAITVVEHDHLTDDPTHPYLPVGRDGRSAEGKAKRKAKKD
jgi:hypothetical protein